MDPAITSSITSYNRRDMQTRRPTMETFYITHCSHCFLKSKWYKRPSPCLESFLTSNVAARWRGCQCQWCVWVRCVGGGGSPPAQSLIKYPVSPGSSLSGRNSAATSPTTRARPDEICSGAGVCMHYNAACHHPSPACHSDHLQTCAGSNPQSTEEMDFRTNNS